MRKQIVFAMMLTAIIMLIGYVARVPTKGERLSADRTIGKTLAALEAGDTATANRYLAYDRKVEYYEDDSAAAYGPSLSPNDFISFDVKKIEKHPKGPNGDGAYTISGVFVPRNREVVDIAHTLFAVTRKDAHGRQRVYLSFGP